jgi:hypothetical protein
MFTNSINARKMLHDAFSYSAPAPAPAPKAPRGKARTTPAKVEETFESDSESSYQGSVGSASSMVSTDDVPVPPLGSAAPRIGPTKSAKIKKLSTKKMAKPKVEAIKPPPAAPVLKEAPAPVPEKVKKVSKKLTKKEPSGVNLALPEVPAMPEKIVLAEKLEQSEKKKRAPSEYNKFVSTHMKNGLSMVAIAGLWKDQKKVDAK